MRGGPVPINTMTGTDFLLIFGSFENLIEVFSNISIKM
jgi:hypothetical protein